MRNRPIVPYNLRLRPRARELRRDPTPAERKLWYLFLSQLPCKFTRQKPLGSYEAAPRDARRTAVLEAQGLQVMRVRNDEIRDSFEAVCEKILEVVENET